MSGVPIDPASHSRLVSDLAQRHGFERCGIARLGPIPRGDYVESWLREGRAGTMGYLQRCRDTRLNPSKLLPGSRSAIVVAVNYHQRAPSDDRDGSVDRTVAPRGRVAMYAWGEDYHVVVPERLEALLADLREAIAEPFDAKICVDTSPIIERELAAAAGIGWIGKNTLVLHQSLGSYFFLGAILTTLELMPSAPVADHCGSCTRCLEACPTAAFPAPYEMDATRCISYLTIEHRDEIPEALHSTIGEWVFGCDICQEVCPYNRDAPTTTEPRFVPRTPGPHPSLSEIQQWDEATYQRNVQNSATDRARLHMWKRNAAIAARNIGIADTRY